MVLPITGCMKRRSTSTTTVLAFASLTTTPCRTRFGMVQILFTFGRLLTPDSFGRAPENSLARGFWFFRRGRFGRHRPCYDRALAEHRHDPRDVMAHAAKPRGIFQLAARALKAQIELLLLQARQLVTKLVVGLVAKIGNFGHRRSPYA